MAASASGPLVGGFAAALTGVNAGPTPLVGTPVLYGCAGRGVFAVTTAIAAVTATITAVIAAAARPWAFDAGNLPLRMPSADTSTAQPTSTPAAM